MATRGIFISYRREETAYPAGWLFDRLADHYGPTQIFKDIDSIEPGDDFVDTITAAVGSCDVLLALIGDQWLTMTDPDGGRRIDDPNDFVRLEIEAALSRNVRVIPILVGESRMPRAHEVPPTLAPLVRRQALELSPSRFAADLARLLPVLDRTLAEAAARPVEAPAPAEAPAEPPARTSFTAVQKRVAAVVAAVVLLLILVAVLALGGGGGGGSDSPSDGDTPTEEPAGESGG
ncbi:MAG: toll/interleukin-1 receptor domain-containing protein [Acidimicrobiales bacterium]